MRTIYIIIIISTIITSCKSHHHKEKIEKNHNISLFFYPVRTSGKTYSIDVRNDSLIIEDRSYRNERGIKKSNIHLSVSQIDTINQFVSRIKVKYIEKEVFITDVWTATMIIDNEIYLNQNCMSINDFSPEINQLINYLLSLSPVEFILYSFA